jgi:oligoendopeptidase F
MTEPYQLSAWDLSDLYTSLDDQRLEDDLRRLDAEVDRFEGARGELEEGPPPERFAELVRALEDINRLAGRIHGFASLLFAEDTQNQKTLAFLAQMDQRMASLANRTLFFELWFKQLEQDRADRYLAAAPQYQYFLARIRALAPYTLSEPEEKVINLKDVTGSSALVTLYDSITNRYVFRIEVDGETRELSRAGLMVHAHDPRPELRAAAYQELYRVYGRDAPILGQIYQSLVRDWRAEEVELRGHQSPLAVRNLDNDLPDAAVTALLDVCRENAGLFQRYFRIKARRLGLEKLRRYDLYAPVAAAEKTYNYDWAVGRVLESFRRLDPQMADLAQRIVEDRHVDSLDRPGKRDGAFCASLAPGQTPFVLLNYQGQARDVATLAHELGHGVHSLLAAHHNLFHFHAPLPLAECASIFAEMLLIDDWLDREEDVAVRQELLFKQMDDAYATVMRQAWFATFEIQAHDMIAQGATADDLAEAYRQNLEEQFGDAVELSDEFKWEWASIPHFFHTPFYVYAYSFGQLLVLALYRRYKSNAPDFTERYLDLLRAGGSRPPAELLGELGFDPTSRSFWAGGFEVIEGLIQRLEQEI